MNSITITVPVPSTKLTQVASGHWIHRSNERREARNLAQTLCMKACPTAISARWDKAVIDFGIYYKDNRRRDWPNTISALKAYIDGMVDAGVITDDCWQVLKPGKILVGIDKENPRVEITITRITG